MRSLTIPIISTNFVNSLGKTAIQIQYNGGLETVWANGDQTGTGSLLVNLVVNEVGDTFIATSDSKTLDDTTKKILFLKGEKVSRQKQTMEFKSFAGANRAAEFAQAASGFGLQLVVQM